MRLKSGLQPSTKEHVREIRRLTRKRYSSEEKIRTVLEGLRGEYSIAQLFWREGIAQGLYYKWSRIRLIDTVLALIPKTTAITISTITS